MRDLIQILNSDYRSGLRQLPDQSVNCCVTSPPYWGLRNYGHPDQIGLEASPELIKQVEEGYNGHAIKDYLASSVQDASATKARIINGARKRIDKQRGHSRRHAGFNDKWDALTPEAEVIAAGLPWGWEDAPPDWYQEKKRGQTFLMNYDQHLCWSCNKAHELLKANIARGQSVTTPNGQRSKPTRAGGDGVTQTPLLRSNR